MTTKIVCRLMDVDGRMLGWCEHYAAVRGDGCLRASGPVTIPVDSPGVPAAVSLHWADVNTETRVPFIGGVLSVKAGYFVTIFEAGHAMVTVGHVPIGLPAVTVGTPVSIAVPVGVMGAEGRA